MSLAEGTGGSSSPESAALGEVLAFFGLVADYAAGTAPEEGERIASLCAGMAAIAGFSQQELDALYYAARLRNIGALGNPAYAKGEPLSEREAMMVSWDVPAVGARICERIAALPPQTADIVRWQAECWDGTGYPDQIRWSGVPKAAQLLHLARTYVRSADPEEGLTTITAESGRSFAPDQVRTFIMWFHTFGGEIEASPAGACGLDASRTSSIEIVEWLCEAVDVHNATPGRGRRIARRGEEIGRQLGCDAETLRRITLASLLFGIGELRAQESEAAQFDSLARLGIETRSAHAVAAAKLVGQCPFLAEAAPVLRARSEWYDGTGSPDRLRHDAIPRAAQILAVCIAYDALDEAYRSRITEERTLPIVRLETASGTQFDPSVVRALTEVVKANA